MTYYPVILGDYFHKPWNKDPVLNQPVMEGSRGFEHCSVEFGWGWIFLWQWWRCLKQCLENSILSDFLGIDFISCLMWTFVCTVFCSSSCWIVFYRCQTVCNVVIPRFPMSEGTSDTWQMTSLPKDLKQTYSKHPQSHALGPRHPNTS